MDKQILSSKRPWWFLSATKRFDSDFIDRSNLDKARSAPTHSEPVHHHELIINAVINAAINKKGCIK
jgi:hypothetical protein